MKAMVFCAGKGTRLSPLTDQVPKALVKVHGIPMLKLLLLRLKMFGVTDVIINLHHLPGLILNYLEENNTFGMNIAISDESDELLDTGGGLKKASWYFDEQPFLVHNVDVISDIDLTFMMKTHELSGALATLAVSKRISSRYLLFDQSMELCGWEDSRTGEQVIARKAGKYEKLAFSGVHAVNGKLPGLISEKGAFPVIKMYLRMAREHKIKAFIHDPINWFDLGKEAHIKKAEASFDFNNYLND